LEERWQNARKELEESPFCMIHELIEIPERIFKIVFSRTWYFIMSNGVAVTHDMRSD